MLYLLVIEVLVLLAFYILSKNKYEALVDTKEAREYSLNMLLPMTMLMIELVQYRYASKYDRKTIKAISNLYGGKDVELHMRLFYSSKLAVMIAALVLLTLFGALSRQVDISYILFTLGAPILVFYLYDKDLEKKQRKRYDMIRADFPDVVSKLALLMNAGMTLSRAWERVCSDSKKDTPLYIELKTTHVQLQSGKPESQVFEEFARRCKVKEVTKFITLIIQNLKKGNSDLVPLIKLQAEECWDMRKARAKQLGEEASAKLILPMMIMFIGILIIVLLPAILQLNSL